MPEVQPNWTLSSTADDVHLGLFLISLTTCKATSIILYLHFASRRLEEYERTLRWLYSCEQC